MLCSQELTGQPVAGVDTARVPDRNLERQSYTGGHRAWQPPGSHELQHTAAGFMPSYVGDSSKASQWDEHSAVEPEIQHSVARCNVGYVAYCEDEEKTPGRCGMVAPQTDDGYRTAERAQYSNEWKQDEMVHMPYMGEVVTGPSAHQRTAYGNLPPAKRQRVTHTCVKEVISVFAHEE